jgi:hypothetical protein
MIFRQLISAAYLALGYSMKAEGYKGSAQEDTAASASEDHSQTLNSILVSISPTETSAIRVQNGDPDVRSVKNTLRSTRGVAIVTSSGGERLVSDGSDRSFLNTGFMSCLTSPCNSSVSSHAGVSQYGGNSAAGTGDHPSRVPISIGHIQGYAAVRARRRLPIPISITTNTPVAAITETTTTTTITPRHFRRVECWNRFDGRPAIHPRPASQPGSLAAVQVRESCTFYRG